MILLPGRVGVILPLMEPPPGQADPASAPSAELCTDTGAAAADTPSSGACKRKRKRRSGPAPSNEQAAAQLPGNARHCAVIAMMQPALREYERWLAGQGRELPWVAAGQQQAQQRVGQRQQQHGQVQEEGRQAAERQEGQRCQEEQQGQQGQGEGQDEPQPAGERRLTNWPALYALRRALRPDIWLPNGCPAAGGATGAAQQHPRVHAAALEDGRAAALGAGSQAGLQAAAGEAGMGCRAHGGWSKAAPEAAEAVDPSAWGLPPGCLCGASHPSAPVVESALGCHDWQAAVAAARDGSSSSLPAVSASCAAWSPHKLCGSIVRNPYCVPVLARVLQGSAVPPPPSRGAADGVPHSVEADGSTEAVQAAQAVQWEVAARVLLPARSTFLLSHGVGTLGPLLQTGRRYGLVVIDPPWENASVRRKEEYGTLPARELMRLPLPQLLDQDSGLVAMWLTNREKLHRCVLDELLPRWGLTLLRTWFWIKVHPSTGAPLIPLDRLDRHCYEHLLLLVPAAAAPIAAAAPAEGEAGKEGGPQQQQRQQQRWQDQRQQEQPMEERAALAGDAAAEREAQGGVAVGARAGTEAAGAAGAAGVARAGGAAGAGKDGSAGGFGAAGRLEGDGGGAAGRWACLPADGFTLFSPPGVHSRKPFLGPLLARLRGGRAGERVGEGSLRGCVCGQENGANGWLPEAGGNEGAGGKGPDGWQQQPDGSGVTRERSAAAETGVEQSSGLGGPYGCRCGEGEGEEDDGRLELFARELREGWTSWGNEVLLFQEVRD